MNISFKRVPLGIRRIPQRLAVWVIALASVSVLAIFGYIYLVQPNAVGNLISITPSLLIKAPFDMSLNSRSMENAVDLLMKQIRYGRFLGENEQIRANVEQNAEKFLQYAILVDDFDNFRRLFEGGLLTPSTDHLKGLYVQSQILGGRLDSRVTKLPFDSNQLRETRYERHLLAWKILSRQHRPSSIKDEVCDSEKLNNETLRIHEFSPVVSSKGYMGSSVPIIFAEYWDTSTKQSILSTPGLLNFGELEIDLSFDVEMKNISNLRFHVLSGPGTLLWFKKIKIGDWLISLKTMPLLLKYGFVLDEGQIILTTPHDTLLFLKERELAPQTQDIELEVVVSRAKGLRMVCE